MFYTKRTLYIRLHTGSPEGPFQTRHFFALPNLHFISKLELLGTQLHACARMILLFYCLCSIIISTERLHVYCVHHIVVC